MQKYIYGDVLLYAREHTIIEKAFTTPVKEG